MSNKNLEDIKKKLQAGLEAKEIKIRSSSGSQDADLTTKVLLWENDHINDEEFYTVPDGKYENIYIMINSVADSKPFPIMVKNCQVCGAFSHGKNKDKAGYEKCSKDPKNKNYIRYMWRVKFKLGELKLNCNIITIDQIGEEGHKIIKVPRIEESWDMLGAKKRKYYKSFDLLCEGENVPEDQELTEDDLEDIEYSAEPWQVFDY